MSLDFVGWLWSILGAFVADKANGGPSRAPLSAVRLDKRLSRLWIVVVSAGTLNTAALTHLHAVQLETALCSWLSVNQ